MSKDYNTRFNTMLKYLGITRVDLANITGIAYSTVRGATGTVKFSRWAKGMVWVFEEMKKRQPSDPFENVPHVITNIAEEIEQLHKPKSDNK